MPWKETRTVDQRLQFLSSYQKEEMSVTDLCHEYGISRPTAYKWIKRYDEVGPEGLLNLTRTPHSSPYATSAEIENEILALRKRFPSWGASQEAQGKTRAHEPERELASGEHRGADTQPSRSHQPEEEEATRHTQLTTILDGHRAQSALVHGFQRLLPDWRWVSLRSIHDHGCA